MPLVCSRRAIAIVLCGCALALGALALAKSPPPASAAAISAAELPREGRDVLERIRAGGPFPYERDGVAFGNREGLLPARPSGYYREYTVPTPGLKTRGARRIVCGGPRRTPDACFYTNDHYRSFRRISE
jgi:ribonuclease T1